MNQMINKKQNKNTRVENEVVKELKEGAEDLDILSIDVQGLVSMISDKNIRMYDDAECDMIDVINNIIESRASLNSFFLIDIGAIFRRYKLWIRHMPKVKMFYAVKCNPDKMLLNTLVDLGAGFDVASKTEISTVTELGVDPNKIIFANPVKEINSITFAQTKNINKMTFDTEDELKKISIYHPHAQLVLRILVDDSKSKLQLGSKFGCPKENLPGVFNLAKTLNLNIIGVSFHVGSCCGDGSAYADAIALAKEVFDIAKTYGFDMNFLDIGGGFPGHDTKESDDKFIEIAQNVNLQLDKSFSDVPNLEIIAEPGRFFATSCGTLVTNVICRKIMTVNENEKIIHYYINSSLYGLFNNIIFDKAVPQLELLSKISEDEPLYKSVIFGQTCDSMDKIADNITLPELVCGNWIVIRNHGAYTNAAASTFNGFTNTDIEYVFTY
ncbi:ornithine decarboxylase [Tupanvirus soda lake]|uniref:ornithine decarboxylase n=2 Tax=Tupanvirus TaxID=2094720 RepID=A0A6N1NKX1_9VIRU|nr:ornithine decarboxylase [Tupanvirus soda lake]QKU35264.1 ornithine decarboxylase [Tupanvirus soda lake]